MNTYKVEYSKNVQKILEKMDNVIRTRIIKWIDDNLVNCVNPRLQGKPLRGNFKGRWRYRVGDFRLIADIRDDKIIIVIVDISKRNDAYKKKNL